MCLARSRSSRAPSRRRLAGGAGESLTPSPSNQARLPVEQLLAAVTLFFCPIRASSAHQVRRLRGASPGLPPAGWKLFLKTSSSNSFWVSRPGRQFKAHGLEFAPDRRVVSMRNSSKSQCEIPAAPTHHPVDCRDRPFLNNRRQGLALFIVQLGPVAPRLAGNQPAGPRALKRKTQSRMTCKVTPPIRAASLREPPS